MDVHRHQLVYNRLPVARALREAEETAAYLDEVSHLYKDAAEVLGSNLHGRPLDYNVTLTILGFCFLFKDHLHNSIMIPCFWPDVRSKCYSISAFRFV